MFAIAGLVLMIWSLVLRAPFLLLVVARRVTISSKTVVLTVHRRSTTQTFTAVLLIRRSTVRLLIIMLHIPRLSTLMLRSRSELAVTLVPLIMIPLLLLLLITAVITLIGHAREVLDVLE